MRKLAFALVATAALGVTAPSQAKAWGWGGFAVGVVAGGVIAASAARLMAYPAYSYGGYYPARYSYAYGYPASYGRRYVVVVILTMSS